mmetsp:Transcript_130776/g.418445  ORF Transcript_130776/g.418445 Transcript_130776/m.418445 type:complete len:127 (-) Transcript_130776:250-630(-)
MFHGSSGQACAGNRIGVVLDGDAGALTRVIGLVIAEEEEGSVVVATNKQLSVPGRGALQQIENYGHRFEFFVVKVDASHCVNNWTGWEQTLQKGPPNPSRMFSGHYYTAEVKVVESDKIVSAASQS